MIPVDFSLDELADSTEYYQEIGPDKPPTKGRVAGLMRRLFNYGSYVIATVQARAAAAPEALDHLTRAFRTTDINLIFRRINTALRRCSMLDQRLSFEAGLGLQAALARHRAAHPPQPRQPRAKSDPTESVRPVRTDAEQAAAAAARAERKRAAQSPDGDPSVAQLQADITRRGAGPVIADICRDLGITSRHALWPEVAAAIRAFGGSTEELEQDEKAGMRWCSQTWMALPHPKPPRRIETHMFFRALLQDNRACIGPDGSLDEAALLRSYDALAAAETTGPP